MADGPQQSRSTGGVPSSDPHEHKHVRPLSEREQQQPAAPRPHDKISRLDPTALIGRPSITHDRHERDQDYLIRENARLLEENEFLKGYIARVEAQLKHYQTKYEPESKQHEAHDPLLDDFELPPWTLNARYMSPLLVAYEQRIEELEKINQQHMHDLDQLRAEAEQLVARNREVENELETNIAKLLTGLEQGHVHGGGPLSLSSEELADLQESVHLLREQCDIIKAQETEARQALAHARAQLQERSDEKDMIWSKQVKSLKQQIQQQQQEITRLKSIAQAYGSLKTESSQLRTSLTKATQHEIELQAKLEHAEKALAEATDKHRVMQLRIESNTRDMENMIHSLEGMEKTLATYKGREMNIIKREQEAMERVAQANLEKEQAITKEQNMSKENQRLNERLRSLMDESKRETEATIASIYKKAKETEHKLLDDIKNLELTCADLEHHRDRALRDARSSQLQFDRLVQSTQHEHTRLTDELHKTMTALTAANSEKESANEKMQRMRREQQRIQDQWQRENESLTQQMKDARSKLDQQSLTITSQQEQITTLTDDITRITNQLHTTKQVMESTIQKLQQQIQEMEQGKSTQVAELHHQLEVARKEAQDAASRAASLLQQHDDLTTKWKEENTKTIHHFQTLLREQKERELRLTTQNTSLEQRIQALSQQRAEWKVTYEALQKTNMDLQSALSDTEQRLASHTTQLSILMSREPELIKRNRALESELDKYMIETKRLQRQAINYEKRQEFVKKANEAVTIMITGGPAMQRERERVPLAALDYNNIPTYLSQSTPARSRGMYTQLDIPTHPQPNTSTLGSTTTAPVTSSIPASTTLSTTHSRVPSVSATTSIPTTTTAPSTSSSSSTSTSTSTSTLGSKRLGSLPSLGSTVS